MAYQSMIRSVSFFCWQGLLCLLQRICASSPMNNLRRWDAGMPKTRCRDFDKKKQWLDRQQFSSKGKAQYLIA